MFTDAAIFTRSRTSFQMSTGHLYVIFQEIMPSDFLILTVRRQKSNVYKVLKDNYMECRLLVLDQSMGKKKPQNNYSGLVLIFKWNRLFIGVQL